MISSGSAEANELVWTSLPYGPKQVVASLTAAVLELAETPDRVITIDIAAAEGMPRTVQKETATAEELLEIVIVTSDDMISVKTDDAKLLAHIWAERLTDSLRLLIFGQPPEFSRDTQFGAALDTLHETAAFDRLPVELREALTSFPSLPPPGSSRGPSLRQAIRVLAPVRSPAPSACRCGPGKLAERVPVRAAA